MAGNLDGADHPLTSGVHVARPQNLHPRVVWLWRTTALSGGLLAVAAATAAFTLIERQTPTAVWVLVSLLGIGAAWAGANLRYTGWAFEIRTNELRIRRGVLVRTTSVIPFGRIQHVDVRQNVLERWLGLARILIYTAGVYGAETVVPGLALADAEALRDQLAAFAGMADRAV